MFSNEEGHELIHEVFVGKPAGIHRDGQDVGRGFSILDILLFPFLNGRRALSLDDLGGLLNAVVGLYPVPNIGFGSSYRTVLERPRLTEDWTSAN